MRALACAAEEWDADKVKAGCGNTRPTEMVTAGTNRRSWLTELLDLWSKNGRVRPKFQAPHAAAGLFFRRSRPVVRLRSNRRSVEMALDNVNPWEESKRKAEASRKWFEEATARGMSPAQALANDPHQEPLGEFESFPEMHARLMREPRPRYSACLHYKLLAGHTPWGNLSLGYRPRNGKRKRAAGDRWSTVVLQIFRRDKFTCVYCGACGCDLECDHIIPLSRGGDDQLENLATACRPCNQAKGAMTILEWKGQP